MQTHLSPYLFCVLPNPPRISIAESKHNFSHGIFLLVASSDLLGRT